MLKNKLQTSLIVGGMALVGLVAGVATMAGAQSTATKATPINPVVQSQAVDTPEPGDVADNANQAVDTPEAGDVADSATSTNVSSVGHHDESADKANDSDGSATKEAGESASSTDSGE